MRPIATDGVAWFVGRSVFHHHEPCKIGWTDRDAVRGIDSCGPVEPSIRWECRSPVRKGNFEGKSGGPL